MKRKWTSDGLYIIAGSIVGTVSRAEGGHWWYAHGCLSDWEDVLLGNFETKAEAKRSVVKWVKEHD